MTVALCAELDARFVLAPMAAELVKGIAEPVVTYAAREAHRSRRRLTKEVGKGEIDAGLPGMGVGQGTC